MPTITDQQGNHTAYQNGAGGAYIDDRPSVGNPDNDCLEVDAQAMYVLDPSEWDGATNLTFSFWWKTSTLPSAWSVLGEKDSTNNSRAGFIVSGSGLGDNDDVLVVYGNGSNAHANSTSDILVTDTWQLLMMRYDGGATGDANRMKFSVDKTDVSLTYNSSVPATLASNSAHLYMGPWDGWIMGVKFWEATLSDDERDAEADNYNTRTANLISHWIPLGENPNPPSGGGGGGCKINLGSGIGV